MTLDKIISQLESLRDQVGGDTRIGVYSDNEMPGTATPMFAPAYIVGNVKQIKYLLYTGEELGLEKRDDRYDFYIASYNGL